MIAEHLDRELFAAFKAMTLDDGHRLEALGVPRHRWIDLHDAELIGFAPIEVIAGDLFEPVETGKRHLILAVTETVLAVDLFDQTFDATAIIDLVALDVDRPSVWYLRTGAGWALGFDDIRRSQNPVLPAEQAVRMTSNPLEWLRVGGACVLDWSGEATAELRRCTAFHVARETFAASFHARLAKPPSVPPINILGEVRRAA